MAPLRMFSLLSARGERLGGISLFFLPRLGRSPRWTKLASGVGKRKHWACLDAESRMANSNSAPAGCRLALAPNGDLVYEGERKLAAVQLQQGNAHEARETALHALTLAKKAGTVVEIGASLRVLACASEALGDRAAARAYAEEGFALL